MNSLTDEGRRTNNSAVDLICEYSYATIFFAIPDYFLKTSKS